MSFTLFGFSSRNCCNKNGISQKIANTLLPFSYALWAQSKQIPIPIYSNHQIQNYSDSLSNGYFNTEIAVSNSEFVHSPPHDIQITEPDKETKHFESKVVLYKGNKTELILRQDCYAFNCLQTILTKNKGYKDLDELLQDPQIVETPYLWMLMWKEEDILSFDLIVFTDVSVLRMIQDAKTSRSKEAILLINHSLHEYNTTGKMTYKKEKSSTVPHQKVSLFPLRDIPCIKSFEFTYSVNASELVLSTIKPDKNIWQEIEKSLLQEKIRRLETELAQVKLLSHPA